MPDHIRAAWCGHTVIVNVATYPHARPEDLAVAGAALSRICNPYDKYVTNPVLLSAPRAGYNSRLSPGLREREQANDRTR